MHYKGYIITKELPTAEKLADILEKYRENEERKEFAWDWWQIGGRYGGKIKINFNPNEYEEDNCLFQNRNNKYFISEALNELKEVIEHYDELDWLKYMGLRENVLYVDGGYYNDMIDFDITNCYLVIDDKEKIYVRESWNGGNWLKNEKFDDEIKEIDLTDKFIIIIDFHD